MQIIKAVLLFSSLAVTSQNFAQLPVEVISSCKNNKAMRSSVTMTELVAPRFIETAEPGCEEHFENSIDNLTYGGILCANYGYIILNNQRIKLSNATNYSVNPAIKPGEVGAHLDLGADWWKIDFAGNTYLCIENALSETGRGAAAPS